MKNKREEEKRVPLEGAVVLFCKVRKALELSERTKIMGDQEEKVTEVFLFTGERNQEKAFLEGECRTECFCDYYGNEEGAPHQDS